MISGGLDIGTRTAKAVILGESGILASEITPVNDTVDRVSRRILKSALNRAGVRWRKLSAVAATGYGRKGVKAARQEFPNTLCVARAINYLDPEIQTALDIGGLITRVVRIGAGGVVLDYLENERCASGSGRFLEMIAEVLEVSLEQIGPLSLGSSKPLPLTSQCVVFAESEVINHVNAGEEPADILAGLHRSIAERITSLAKKLDLLHPVAVVGGVAKNSGVMHFLEQALDTPHRRLSEDPQIIAAMGAALIARDHARQRGSK
jgi:predicted CoA-substrate-specific enzyme activase